MFKPVSMLLVALCVVLANSPAGAQGKRDPNAVRPARPARLLSDKPNPSMSERNDAVRRKLEQNLEAHWQEVEFGKVIHDLSALLEVQIVLDPEGLEEAGVTPDQLVTLDFEDTRANSLLKVLLEPLHLYSVVREGNLVVTSEEKAGEQLVTRVFKVRDLLKLETTTTEKRLPQGGFGGGAAQTPMESASVTRTPSDKLVDLITSTVTPDSWIDNGGQGSIIIYGGLMVVNQTDDQLEKVEQLLTELRQLSSEKE